MSRQWVLSFPFQLRFLFASQPEIMNQVSGIVYRVIETHLIQQAGCTRATAKTGAVTLIQRFGSAAEPPDSIRYSVSAFDGLGIGNLFVLQSPVQRLHVDGSDFYILANLIRHAIPRGEELQRLGPVVDEGMGRRVRRWINNEVPPLDGHLLVAVTQHPVPGQNVEHLFLRVVAVKRRRLFARCQALNPKT